MPDIFGREPHDYTLVRDLQEAGQWDAYQRGLAQRRAASVPRHDFNALGDCSIWTQQRAPTTTKSCSRRRAARKRFPT